MPRRPAEWYIAQGRELPSYLKASPNYKGIKDSVGNVTILNTAELEETDEQIEKRILSRIDVFESLVDDVIRGDMRGLAVSGPPGMGKSFPVEQKLKQSGIEYLIVKGHASAKGLYETLYANSDEGSVLVLDDADSIFGDEKALNLLKAALDTTEERNLSWITGSAFGQATDDDERDIPTRFTFNGSIIFLTNLDFDGMIAKGNRIAKHLEAIMSRTPYVDLAIRSRRDCMVRVKQVIRDTNMMELNEVQKKEVIKFLEDNVAQLRELSLRTALKVGMFRKSNSNWYDIAKITCCKN